MTPSSQSKEELTALADELERDYPAVDVTTTVFSRDFAGVGCCVIPQDRVLAIVTALRALPQQPAAGTASVAGDGVREAATKALGWFERSNDGEDGCDYLNGDSTKYPGNGQDDAEALEAELRAALSAPSPSSIELDGGVREAVATIIAGDIYGTPDGCVGPATRSARADGLKKADDVLAALAAGTTAGVDSARLDWLQGRIVDTVYLDDGKIIDVKGGDLRQAIDAAKVKWPNSLEDDEGDAKPAALNQTEARLPAVKGGDQ